MGDLEVDLGELQRTGDELAALMVQFDQAKEIAADEDLGSPRVLSALHEFATNWNVHKKDLLKEMTAVHDMIDKSRSALPYGA